MIITSLLLRRFLDLYQPIVKLGQIQSILDWDLNVNLPPKGAQARANQSAFLSELLTDQWNNPELSQQLDSLLGQDGLSDQERRLVKVIHRAQRFYRLVPKDLIVKKKQTSSQAFMAWHQAKEDNDFESFRPHLAELVAIDQLMANHLGFTDNPYDALLNQYDDGLTASFCFEVFSQLQPKLTELTHRIQQSSRYQPTHPLTDGTLVFATEDQQKLGLFVLRKMGYDAAAGRLDVVPHPFSTDLGWGDTRITTRYLSHDPQSSLAATMHEGGHALYSQGIPEEMYEVLSGEQDLSFSIHESQSRFWENQVGRSPQFIQFLTPLFQSFFPDQMHSVDTETLIRVFNRVQPGFIRIEADEVTYPLHIMVRFDIENDLINNRLDAKDVPDAWRQKMQTYLGVTPPTDRDGCLQDVHWSYGNFGYFPTYALGTLYAAQFAATMKQELFLDSLLPQGEMGPILGWLRHHIHQHGPLYSPEELAVRVTGHKLNPQHFTDYITQKYSDIYQLAGQPPTE
jgi:carboxypeptidase Taq